jgi:predicted nucleic acid-binding protein
VFPTVGPTDASLATALDLVVAKRTGFWDGLLVATAQTADCTLLLSEDMQDGVRFGKLTVRNPFKGDTLDEEIGSLIGLER